MNSRDQLRWSVRCTLACTVLAACFTLPAYAQDTAEEGPEQEVVVTGSRIPQPNQISTSPVQVVTSEDILLGGRTDMSDMLNQMPQVVNNSLGQGLGNRTSGLTTAGGVSTVELRGLGPQRTLVLVNGRRLGIGSPYTAIQSPAPNIDQIPTFLLDRVEVVTGGASAVYGSDAIAGVVNFITKRNFEGFQVDYQIGENWYENDSDFVKGLVRDFGATPLRGTSRDGRTHTFNVMAGTNFAEGKGNVTAYFGYYSADPIASGDRDFGGCQLALADAATPVCIGSGNSNRFTVGTTQYAVVGNEFLPWDPTANTRNPPGSFNSQQYIFAARDDQRYNAGFMAHVDVNDAVRPYIEFGFMQDKTHQEIAPSGLFENSNPTTATGGYVVNCSNPFLSAQQRGILGCSDADVAADLAAIQGNGTLVTRELNIGRRNLEGGGRTSDYRHTNYRAVAGVSGDFAEAWNYDAHLQYYSVDFFNSNNRYFSFNNINNALLVTGTATDPQCVNGGNCVPYNIFQEGGVSQEAVNYLSLAGTGSGSTTLRTMHADITGDLGNYNIKSPFANDGLSVNFGFERRKEDISFNPDAAELSGDLSGFGGASVALTEEYDVDEAFIELRAPLLQGRPGVHDLVFNTGYRRSDYSTIGVVNTHKFELLYSPVSDLGFRAGFQRAIRAPSLVELFNPPLVGKISFGEDPCAPSEDTGELAATFEQCARTGVTLAQYEGKTIPQGTATQLSQLQGGNVALQAESADSYILGMTFAPAAIPNLTGSVDYYRIKLEGGVGVFPANVILTNCLNTGDPVFCSQLVRAPSTGTLDGASVETGGYIVQTNQNLSQVDTDGIDLQTNYRLPQSERWGRVSFSLNGSYLLSAETTPAPGVAAYDCVGLFGPICQTVNPKWRHLLRTSWETPWSSLLLSVNWRHFGAVSLDQNESNETLHFATIGERAIFGSRISAYNYFDLSASWSFNDNLRIRGGVNNMFDKNPPVITSEFISGGGANTYETYDALGRQLFLAFTAKF